MCCIHLNSPKYHGFVSTYSFSHQKLGPCHKCGIKLQTEGMFKSVLFHITVRKIEKGLCTSLFYILMAIFSKIICYIKLL
jgi:hypothetical protein